MLSRGGYQLLLANTENNEQEELKYLKLFRENHVDGVILSGTMSIKVLPSGISMSFTCIKAL